MGPKQPVDIINLLENRCLVQLQEDTISVTTITADRILHQCVLRGRHSTTKRQHTVMNSWSQ
jgi:hypothetical protein